MGKRSEVSNASDAGNFLKPGKPRTNAEVIAARVITIKIFSARVAIARLLRKVHKNPAFAAATLLLA
jgi:hypothetical protein